MKPNIFIGWLSLTVALGLHVADEALNDFLTIYNPMLKAFVNIQD